MKMFSKKSVNLLLVLSLVAFALVGCSNNEPVAKEPLPEIVVSAAASLTDALDELVAVYATTADAACTVVVTYGGSGALSQQIINGAPADLFLSASVKNMNQIVDAGLVEGETVTLLKNSLVLIAPTGSTLTSVEDIVNLKMIAIGEPESVPAGNYAKEAMTNLGLWDAVEGKLVMGSDVRQVLSYVETASADAGFVYSTDAITSSSVVVVAEVPAESYTPVTYPAALLKGDNAEAAAAFLAFLQSDAAKAVWEEYGFTVAE